MSFQRQSTAQDAIGQRVDTWSEFASRMCSIEPLNGREYFNASGEHSEVSTRIRTRHDSVVGVVKPDDRILDQTTSPNTVFDILSVINSGDRDREIVLMCRRVFA